MNRQLTIFDVHDSDQVSGTEFVHDKISLKQQAIQRYLDRAASKDPVAHIETYHPGRRDTEYYRLVYRRGQRLIRIHIPGGSTISELAQYRAGKLQELIDRGAELAEVLAMVQMFKGNNSEQ